MSEEQYFLILDHINACHGQNHGLLSPLPKRFYEQIWSLMSEAARNLPAPNGSDFKSYEDLREADNLRPQAAKDKLCDYVFEHGPFVFEDGRCYFILAHQFGHFDWQDMNIPAIDVTDIAQQAFLSPRRLSV
jgi:hypothetical protein